MRLSTVFDNVCFRHSPTIKLCTNNYGTRLSAFDLIRCVTVIVSYTVRGLYVFLVGSFAGDVKDARVREDAFCLRCLSNEGKCFVSKCVGVYISNGSVIWSYEKKVNCANGVRRAIVNRVSSNNFVNDDPMFSSRDVNLVLRTVDRFCFRVSKRTLFTIDKYMIRSSY